MQRSGYCPVSAHLDEHTPAVSFSRSRANSLAKSELDNVEGLGDGGVHGVLHLVVVGGVWVLDARGRGLGRRT